MDLLLCYLSVDKGKSGKFGPIWAHFLGLKGASMASNVCYDPPGQRQGRMLKPDVPFFQSPAMGLSIRRDLVTSRLQETDLFGSQRRDRTLLFFVIEHFGASRDSCAPTPYSLPAFIVLRRWVGFWASAFSTFSDATTPFSG